MCGMTTAWSYLAHGNVRDAAGVNLGGLLLAFYALIGCEFARRMIQYGRWPSSGAIAVATYGLLGILMVTLCDWWLRVW